MKNSPFKIIAMGCFWLVLIQSNAQTTLTLQDALRIAKTNNPILKTQQYNINIAQSDVITAGLKLNPKLNNQSLQLVRPSLFPTSTEWYNNQNRQVWWQLTKTFQLPSQYYNKIDFALQNVNLTQRTLNEAERAILQEVAIKWLDAWTARKKLDILQVAKEYADSLVFVNKLRLKNQVITSTDLARTELLASQFGLKINSATQIYNNEIKFLQYLTGATQDISIDTSSNFVDNFSSSIDSLLLFALKTRSDILMYKTAIDVANSNIKLQKSLSIPQPELGVIWNPQNSFPYLGFFGTIEIPLFARNQGEIKKSQLLKQQAEQSLSVSQLQLQTELSTAYSTFLTQKLNLLEFDKMILQSRTILKNVEYSYLHGATTIIDFLEAQRSWLDTQQQYFDTLQEYRLSYIKLLFTSGLINKIAQ